MKKLINGRWFLLAIIVVAEAVLFVFLYCKGFRVTYTPDMENSWDAVSAFATWAGVIMSFVAVLVAGYVAWKQIEISSEQASIADKQNKIALFEKRLEIYDILTSCWSSAEIIKLTDDNENVLSVLFITLTEHSQIKEETNSREMIFHITNYSAKLQKASFLFSKEIATYITDVSIKLLVLANSKVNKDSREKFNKKKNEYLNAIKELDEYEVFRQIREDLNVI